MLNNYYNADPKTNILSGMMCTFQKYTNATYYMEFTFHLPNYSDDDYIWMMMYSPFKKVTLSIYHQTEQQFEVVYEDDNRDKNFRLVLHIKK